MAHQYSSAPSYGAQYQSIPYYSLFAPTAGQPVGSAMPNFQQMNVHQTTQNASPASNQARYDANTQIHAQPAPLPFPSHFDPELLKHFPPPPLIPPGHFAPAPGSVTNFGPFPPTIGTPPLPLPQHNFNPFPQPTTPSSGMQLNAQAGGQNHEQRTYGQPTRPKETEDSIKQGQGQFSPAPPSTGAMRMESSTGQTLDGMVEDSKTAVRSAAKTGKPLNYSQNHTAKLVGGGHRPHASHQSLHSNFTGSNSHSQPGSQTTGSLQPSQSELKERAKAALLSLVPHNIRYNDFLKEGVSASILQQLYEELGLSWRSQPDDPAKALAETKSRAAQQDGVGNTAVSSSDAVSFNLNSSAPNAVKASPAVASISRPSPTASSSIERKDRIAQLLAAKAGKTASSAAASQIGSPASVADSIPTNSQEIASTGVLPTTNSTELNRNATGAKAVQPNMEQVNKETVFGSQGSDREQNTTETTVSELMSRVAHLDKFTPLQAASLPTPLKEQIAKSEFASLIPGLFMTSAEAEEAGQPEEPAETQHLLKDKTDSPSTGEYERGQSRNVPYISQPARKRSRSADRLGEGDYLEPKRRVAQASDPADMDMDNDEASEGEIIEDEIEPLPKNRATITAPTLPMTEQSDVAAPSLLSKPSDDVSVHKRAVGVGQQQLPRRGQSYALSPTGSTTSAPMLAQASQTATSSPTSKFSDNAASIAKQDDRSGLPPVTLVKMTPEQIKEKAAKAKETYLRQRALRQRQLQEGIPFLNDEVMKTQTKLKETKSHLAQIQGEVQEYETSLTRAREAERKLQDEVERLEKQISEGLSGQKQFSSELHELKQQSNNDSAIPIPTAPVPVDQPGTDDSGKSSIPLPVSPQQLERDKDSILSESANSGNSGILENGSKNLVSDAHVANVHPQEVQMSEAVADTVTEESSVEETSPTAPSAFTASAGSSNRGPIDEANDSDEAMEESNEDSDDSRMSIDEDSDDSASMSDSGSDDYEPAEPEMMQQDDRRAESEDYEPEIMNDQQPDDLQEDDGDEYEPADDLSPSGDFTAASDSVSRSPSALTSTSKESSTEAAVPRTTEEALRVSAGVVDGQEKGPQLSDANALTKVQSLPQASAADSPKVLGSDDVTSSRYVPYQSPLSSFKSYRFHPFFNEQVKDGYRSLTYSHKIDPKLPLCLKELEGEACTDPGCQDQHFGSMALTDDKILVQMSSANDIKDKALRDQYLLGLKQVIARLRQEGVKEFSAVADALSQYRREWTATRLGS